MHELSIAKGILNTVNSAIADQNIKAVKLINLSMGGMLDYEADWIARYIRELGADTPLREVNVHINKLPITFECRNCGQTFSFKRDGEAVCPHCESTEYDLTGGRELFIENIEVEDDEEV